jgi:hypothetical protein
LDLHTLYEQNELCDLNTLDEKLRKFDESKWQKAVESKPKLRLYKKLKKSLETEKYVKFNCSRAERSHGAQFRAGILKINIELGRMARLKIEERVCPFCQNDLIEDELHFTFKCPKYENERKLMMRKLEEKNILNATSMELEQIRFLKLLFNEQPQMLLKYIADCISKRKAALYV